MKRLVLAAALVVCLAIVPANRIDASPRLPIDLGGTWSFALDPGDRGIKEQWFRTPLPDRIQLPGALQAQGFGQDVSVETDWTGQIVDRSWFTAPEYAPYRRPGQIKIPFWLQPDKHYVGAAWYQRGVTIPASWSGRRLVLNLERPHIETRVWLDDRELGSRNSLSTPHVYDLGTAVQPGPHRLTVRVDNRLVVDVGINSHSVTDHTQSNWNGIAGRIELGTTGMAWIDDVQVYPDVARRSAFVTGRLGNASGRAGRCDVSLTVERPDRAPLTHTIPVWLPADGGTFGADVALGPGAPLWEEFHPNLYRVTARIDDEDERTVGFGLRAITTRGTRFVLNDRPIFLRGTLECCIFPRTGSPPTDEAAWERIIRICKAHGLNHMRFHSWCPPEAAFEAADRLGFYLYVECASWASTSTSLGEGKPIDRWVYDEADRILRAYGNHPSFLLMSYGNEPAGKDKPYLAAWVDHYRKRDGRRLYTSAAGWPELPENQFHITPEPRIQHWGEGLRSRINARPPETVTDYRDFVQARTVPVVSHEIGEWCVYPNFDEIPKYTGHLKPKNFEIFRDVLSAHQMGDQARAFVMASGKLQTLCYKEEIESALRTPGFGGFELLGLHDFPGQGTALVGVLDPFWDSKPYVTPGEFRRFCGPIVPLARLPRRVFMTDETLRATIELAHFGPDDLDGATIAWRLETDPGVVAASGRFGPRSFRAGDLHPVEEVVVPLRGLDAPRKLRLVAAVEGARSENDWDLWIFPPRVDPEPGDVLVTRRLDEAAVTRLEAGGKVLLLLPPGRVACEVALGFSPVFWNTAWTRGQPPHSLGLLCDPAHPALARFPTEAHTNWQWWELIHGGAAMALDRLPSALRPIVQPIDTWFQARRLGLAFEARVQGGKLLVCSMDLTTALDQRPVARQMRHSLLSYMAGTAFHPTVEVGVEAIRALTK